MKVLFKGSQGLRLRNAMPSHCLGAERLSVPFATQLPADTESEVSRPYRRPAGLAYAYSTLDSINFAVGELWITSVESLSADVRFGGVRYG